MEGDRTVPRSRVGGVLMAVGFSTDISFSVVPDDDGYLPYPVPDEHGLLVYTASVILSDQAEYLALLAYHSTVTVLPALGGGGLLVVERGSGRRQLTIPLSGGGETTYYGVLTSIQATARMLADDHVRADCEWMLAASADG